APSESVDPLGLQLVPVTLPGVGPTYLDSTFVPTVDAFVQAARDAGVNPTFASAFRDPDKQQSLKNDPNATTPADVSLHSAGFAVDVSLAGLSKGERDALVQAADDVGLSWGGRFNKPDPGHFFHDPRP